MRGARARPAETYDKDLPACTAVGCIYGCLENWKDMVVVSGRVEACRNFVRDVFTYVADRALKGRQIRSSSIWWCTVIGQSKSIKQNLRWSSAQIDQFELSRAHDAYFNLDSGIIRYFILFYWATMNRLKESSEYERDLQVPKYLDPAWHGSILGSHLESSNGVSHQQTLVEPCGTCDSSPTVTHGRQIIGGSLTSQCCTDPDLLDQLCEVL